MTAIPNTPDGANQALGAKANAAQYDPTATDTHMAFTKAILGTLQALGVYNEAGVGPLSDGDLVRLQVNLAGNQLFSLADLLSALAGDSTQSYLVANTAVTSLGNSTTTALGVSAAFPGLAESTAGMDVITVTVLADVKGVLTILQSPDNVNFDTTDSYTYQPNSATSPTDKVYYAHVRHPWYKVQYNNGATAQATMRLQTTLAPVAHRFGHARTNALRRREVVHRSLIATPDKIAQSASSMVSTGAGGGSLTTGTTYNWAVIPGNKYGPAGSAAAGSASGSQALGGGSTAVRITGAPTTADESVAEYLDVFCSQTSPPYFVARVTPAQVATGLFITVASTGTAGATIVTSGATAGNLDIRVAGSSSALQTTASAFAQNNGYTPAAVATASGYVDCTGFSLAHIQVALTLTDLYAAPACTIVPFLYNDADGLYVQQTPIQMQILSGLGQALRHEYVLQTDGASRLVVCVGDKTGNGLKATITVQLS